LETDLRFQSPNAVRRAELKLMDRINHPARRRTLILRRQRAVAKAAARLAGAPVPARLWAAAAYLAEI